MHRFIYLFIYFLFSCKQLDLHKSEETHGTIPSKVEECVEGLGIASSGFTKPHTADNTHHFGQSQEVHKQKLDQNCFVVCLFDG